MPPFIISYAIDYDFLRHFRRFLLSLFRFRYCFIEVSRVSLADTLFMLLHYYRLTLSSLFAFIIFAIADAVFERADDAVDATCFAFACRFSPSAAIAIC